MPGKSFLPTCPQFGSSPPEGSTSPASIFFHSSASSAREEGHSPVNVCSLDPHTVNVNDYFTLAATQSPGGAVRMQIL